MNPSTFSKKTTKKQWHSINISQLLNDYATTYFLKKLMHLQIKLEGKFFDLLKPKSCLSRLEDIAHAS